MGAKAPANIKAVQIGEHNVQNDQVGGVSLQVIKAGLPPAEASNFKTFLQKIVAHEFDNVGFVFDDCYSFGHGGITPSADNEIAQVKFIAAAWVVGTGGHFCQRKGYGHDPHHFSGWEKADRAHAESETLTPLLPNTSGPTLTMIFGHLCPHSWHNAPGMERQTWPVQCASLLWDHLENSGAVPARLRGVRANHFLNGRRIYGGRF